MFVTIMLLILNHIGQKLDLLYYELKLQVYVMIKAVSNRDICFTKQCFIILQTQALFKKKIVACQFDTPARPTTIRVK